MCFKVNHLPDFKNKFEPLHFKDNSLLISFPKDDRCVNGIVV